MNCCNKIVIIVGKTPQIMIEDKLRSALKSYEEKREKIYKEMKIAFIQEKVKRKLLKINGENIDLLFFTEDYLIDESQDQSSENIEIENVSYEAENDTENEAEIEENGNNKNNINQTRNLIDSKLCKFLDLEAEYSGEEDEENEVDGDLEGIIDNSVDDSAEDRNLEYFAKEREENDRAVLKSLESKFIKKSKKKIVKNFTILESCEMEEFPDFESLEIEEKEPIENAEVAVCSEFGGFKRIKVEDSNLFNNEREALEKLSKKEEGKARGFFERI